ncbi:hypothetical protein [Ammoniphilus sp. 3BR4]|uniref:hypothetical protein n=1 Tax=Ammoniphilus sp. 3BR4 TaxID=3158265 RepID=UPI003466C8DD
MAALQAAGVQVLKDSYVTIGDGFYLIGRDTIKLYKISYEIVGNEASMKIDYDTRRDLQEGKKGAPPKATQILI